MGLSRISKRSCSQSPASRRLKRNAVPSAEETLASASEHRTRRRLFLPLLLRLLPLLLLWVSSPSFLWGFRYLPHHPGNYSFPFRFFPFFSVCSRTMKSVKASRDP
ncbi:hypothetical protein PVAP13_9NG594014 [Panicum virgatum]|uniref:Transmembrane protein n=1 Tax=Panicum virgatum TaxID=38727 RepID=A0A8T0N142_PANVG|nr:hypothetical protein PVAP13_9NG594014 [Panicum virgatum]